MNNEELNNRITALETQMREHHHDGFLGGQVYLRNLWGLFETVSVAPTTTPKTTYDQIKFYSSGGTFRFYMYDSVGGAWHYVALT
jgi:hypothetical protein